MKLHRTLPLAFAFLLDALSAQTQGSPTRSKVSDGDLERAYWTCMELSAQSSESQQRMNDSAIALCAQISKELQVRRFGDDFGRLHEWTESSLSRTPQARSLDRPAF